MQQPNLGQERFQSKIENTLNNQAICNMNEVMGLMTSIAEYAPPELKPPAAANALPAPL